MSVCMEETDSLNNVVLNDVSILVASYQVKDTCTLL